MMVRYTITPWKHPSDLIAVRAQLYNLDSSSPDSADHRRHAVDRIMAWKLRSNLPHAVESTALLVEAQLHHQSAAGTAISEFSVRAVYAAAFTRFVTGFCDIGRSREKGLEQSSMLAVAKQIGMPVEFVGLRHEATHEELPGLRRLVKTVEEALGWLWGVYWARLDEGGVEGAGVGERRDEMVALLKGFRREKRDALRSRSKGGGDLEEQTTEACLALGPRKRAVPDLVSDVLANERLLLPTNRNMGESMDGAFLIWDDMLRSLTIRLPTLPQTLLDTMFAAIVKPSAKSPQHDTDKEALSQWLVHLNKTLAGASADGRLVQQCCLHPGYWTQRIGQQLLDTGDDALREAWADVFAASLLDAGKRTSTTDGAQSVSMAEAMDVDEEVVSSAGGARPAEGEGRWTRTIVPPSLPMGVVR